MGNKGHGGHGRGPAGKPKNVRQTLKRLFSYMGGHSILLIPVMLCVLISSGAMIAGTYMLKPALNNYIIPLIGHQNPDLTQFI